MFRNRYLSGVCFFTILIFNIPAFALAGQYKVVRVYDGDILKAVENGIEIMVRLVGIDAPEISTKKHLPGQPFSQKAKEYLSKLVLKKNVQIKLYGVDHYTRVLAEVFVSGKNVNIEMLKAGLAEVYRGKPATGLDLNLYKTTESKAKKDEIGIWSLRDQYFSPKSWRELYRD